MYCLIVKHNISGVSANLILPVICIDVQAPVRMEVCAFTAEAVSIHAADRVYHPGTIRQQRPRPDARLCDTERCQRTCLPPVPEKKELNLLFICASRIGRRQIRGAMRNHSPSESFYRNPDRKDFGPLPAKDP